MSTQEDNYWNDNYSEKEHQEYNAENGLSAEDAPKAVKTKTVAVPVEVKVDTATATDATATK